MTQHIQENVLDYVERTQAVIEKTDEAQRAYAGRIPAVVDQLIASALVPEEHREKLAEDLKNPANALDCIVTIAKLANLDTSLGQPVDNPTSTKPMDAFQRWILLGDPNAVQS